MLDRIYEPWFAGRHVGLLLFVTLAWALASAAPVAAGAERGPSAVEPSLGVCGSSWQPTGSLITARLGHTATQLPDGTVLAVGGIGRDNGASALSASAEVYNPSAGQWHVTGSLHQARSAHTATLLPNGQVLVAGGYGGGNPASPLATAELYDPATGQWRTTGTMHAARALHTATQLPSGRVLVVGGDGNTATNAELYDPATGSWSAASNLPVDRNSHTATLLADGQVLVTGGKGNTSILSDTEIYSPTANTWLPTEGLKDIRYGHTATRLSDGSVLVAGGYQGFFAIESAERYDPVSHRWNSAGDLVYARAFHTASLLPSGAVLIAGGEQGLFAAYFADTEVYLPAANRWTFGPTLPINRSLHTATQLLDGTLLVAGGGNTSNEMSSVARFEPADASGCTKYLLVVMKN